MGHYDDRTIKVSMIFSNTTGNTTWNSTRNDFFEWINTANWDNLWFYIKHNDGTTITRTRCYPSPSSSEKYNYIKVSEAMTFEFLCPKPYFTNTTASTGTKAIADSSEHSQAITNNGNLETSIQCKFTPTGTETLFQVELADDYGFRLEKYNFAAAEQIVYDTADGSMTINSLSVNASQYLTAGTIFNLPIGASTLYITCSGAGTFAWSFSERYI